MNKVTKRNGLNLIPSQGIESTPQIARTDANLVLEPCAYTFRCAVHTICSSPKAPWNQNGVRTIPQYHPCATLRSFHSIYASNNGLCRWNTFKYWDAILKELRADIICFQGAVSRRGYPSTCLVHIVPLRNEEQPCSNRT